jgi:hypothetical protein
MKIILSAYYDAFLVKMINRSANQQQMQLLSVVASQEVLAVSC